MPQRFLNSVLSIDQLKVFLICVSVGAFGFLFRELLFACLTPLKKSKWEGRAYCAYELAFFAVFAVIFLCVSVRFDFPPFRGYMFFGIAVGFLIYYKILRIILAFSKKICYNIWDKKVRKRKNSEK